MFKYKYGHNPPTVHTDLQYQELNLIQAEILKGQEKPPLRGVYTGVGGFNLFLLSSLKGETAKTPGKFRFQLSRGEGGLRLIGPRIHPCLKSYGWV